MLRLMRLLRLECKGWVNGTGQSVWDIDIMLIYKYMLYKITPRIMI